MTSMGDAASRLEGAVLRYQQNLQSMDIGREYLRMLGEIRQQIIWEIWELCDRNAIIAADALGITSSVVSRVIRGKAGGKSPRGLRRKLKKLDGEVN